MPATLLVLNAGSSSIKFQLFAAEPELRRLHRGQLDGIGVKPRLRIVSGSEEIDRALPAEEGADVGSAFAAVERWLSRALGGVPVSP